MFYSIDPDGKGSDYPRGSSIDEADWHILAGFWHPVAFSHQIERPLAATLLDVDLVVYRSAPGAAVSVAADRCPHRGVRLSLGRVDADQLVCPMHGMRFDGDGRCRAIPSLSDPNAPISSRMRLQTYLVEERYGIVWTCLKPKPIWPLPRWPGIDNPAYKKVFVPSEQWRTSAARHAENFNDQAHFPFVHLHSFGSDETLSVHDYDVEDTEFGLRFDYPYSENGNRFPDGVVAERRDVIYRYELTLPFSTLIIVDVQGSDFVHYFADAVCPVSADRTRVFQLLTDSSGDPEPDYWINDSLQILAEDRPLVESQPVAMPLDNGVELHHLPADRWSIRYRKLLRERFGLGAARRPPP